ncbi:MAG: hypothetical protein HY964_09305 [Ignavibacteriales bacterium]|nr:hypothetical protein [Ignavibacteriales bacterium]
MKKIFNLILIVILVGSFSFAGTKNKKNSNLPKPTVNFATRIKQGFNMKVWLSNQMTMGLQAWDGAANSTPDGYGLEYPAGSGVEHLYGAGPRIGGKVDGSIRVTEGYNGSDARKEFLPEYIHLPRERFWQTSTMDTTWENPYKKVIEKIPNKRGCDDDNDGLIDEDDLDGLDNDGDWNPLTDDVGYDGLPSPLELSCDGKAYDPVSNPDPWGDDFDPGTRDRCHPTSDGAYPWKNNPDVYTERNGKPDHGEPNVDEDYGAISEKDLYCSATDTFRRPTIGGHRPLGIKVIQKSYAWDNKDAEGILPFDYFFINVGKKVITDVWVGFFADCDLGPVNVPGYYSNNYTAYMESLRTAYTHNPINRGSTPVGFTVLATPKPLDSIRFVWQWADFTTPGHIDPGVDDSLIYTWLDGSAFPRDINPSQSPNELSDTRFYFSFGPFESMYPGDTLRISMALIAGDGVFEGANSLKENAEDAMKLYTRGYVTPITPVSPYLKLDTLPDPGRGIKLTWFPHLDYKGNPGGPFTVWDDSNKLAQGFPRDHWRRANPPCGEGSSACSGHICIGDSLPGGRIFSGFRLYRSEDPGDDPQLKSFTLIKQYSIPDSAKLWTIEELVAKYLDSTFVDSPLVRGKRYWYAVTAYGLPDIAIISVRQQDGTVRYDSLYTSNTESAISQNRLSIDIPFAPSDEVGKVFAVPNPYRVDEEYTYENGGWEGLAKNWSESNRRIKFIHLPKGEWTLRIFTMVGDLITTIKNTAASGYQKGNQTIDEYKPDRGEINWDLLSESNRALASGVYIFSVESDLGTQVGKFVLIR